MIDYKSRRIVMVDTQVRPSDVTKFPIIDAMLSVPRENYVPDNLREAAYIGENLEIAEGRVMLEPRTLAKMLEALDIEQHHDVLDIACGLGYSTAILAQLSGFVVGLEEDAQLAEDAQSLLSGAGVDNAAVVAGDLVEGAQKSGPYNIILIQGGVEEVSDPILQQLAEGGRIACIFVEGTLGVVRIGHKIDGQMTWRFTFNANAPVLDGFKKQSVFAL